LLDEYPVITKRQVFVGEEQGEIPVPIELIFKDGKLDIYEDVLRRNFFRLFLKTNKLIFQAAGFLGIIPINDSVAIEVRARVPVDNLERLLQLTPQYTPEILRGRLRNFGLNSVTVPSLLDLLATRLLDAVKEVRAEGLHYLYTQRVHFNSSPAGRILPFQSAKLQNSTGRRLAVASSAFVRTFDTAPNRCLRLSVKILHDVYQGMRNRKGARVIASQLAIAGSYLEIAKLDYSLDFLSDPLVRNPWLLPTTRSSYSSALSVAKMILKNQSVNIRSQGPDILLSSLLVNMEEVFEGYLRAVLTKHLNTNELSVLDGNLNEPAGAARPFFDEDTIKGRPATPDVVIGRLSPQASTELLIDAKYKPVQNLPDREDINQILAYTLVYGCGRVALAYRRRRATESNIMSIGTVAGIEIFKISVDLGAVDLQEEEKQLADAIRPFCMK
jgi:5-methylcytosine-specific restriction enzyme subunit McrC